LSVQDFVDLDTGVGEFSLIHEYFRQPHTGGKKIAVRGQGLLKMLLCLIELSLLVCNFTQRRLACGKPSALDG
jgi:hypothetical protein